MFDLSAESRGAINLVEVASLKQGNDSETTHFHVPATRVPVRYSSVNFQTITRIPNASPLMLAGPAITLSVIKRFS